MRSVFFIFLISFSAVLVNAQSQKEAVKPPVKEIKNQVVDAACGECQFKMEGKSCDLAVKINGVSYFVDGTDIDDHGDAHSSDGFCEKVRKATVSGSIVNNRFVATSFKLMPEPNKKKE